MTRDQTVLRFITREMRGIEVAPYHSPLASKAQGYNCLTLDIFNFEQLRENARNDPNVRDKIHRIESVDIVASATDLEAAVAARGELESFDYILSSHNFEHLPNPIRFLNACGAVLKKDGLLTMAIPNKRFTFDYSRALSSFANFYRAFHENHSQPDPWISFDFGASFAKDVPVSPGAPGIPKYANNLTEQFNELQRKLKEKETGPYVDAHVWVFTPESFISIIKDCIILKLIPLRLVHVELVNFEFYVHFRNTGFASAEYISQLEENRSSSAALAFRS